MFRTHSKIFICLTLIALFTATAYAKDPPEIIKQRIGKGDPVAGKEKSQLCQGCHGEDGNSVEPMIPKLAGQYSFYIAKELRNFQSGERKHQIMSAMAATISDADLADIAAYFASQDKMKGDGSGENAVGHELVFNGDMSRGIQACMTCHGVNGKGITGGSTQFPVIGGQHKAYLREQLFNWRSSSRTNSPIMNKVAKLLTDEEIDAIGDYLNGK
ncbi:MAG: c-type cytochrome [Pseudomonadota bacterium]